MKLSTHETFPQYNEDGLDKPNAMHQAVSAFERHEVDTLQEVAKLITTEDCVYAPIHWRKNHRNLDNAILEDIDLLAYDSDDGQTSTELLNLFTGVEMLLLRTASWSKELEKYRILIPLDEPIRFEDPNEYRLFYRWLGDLIGIEYDEATTECGRGYIGLSQAKSLYSKGVRINPKEAWDNYYIPLKKKQEKQQARDTLRAQLRREQTQKKYGDSQIKPEHLYKKDKFKDYLSNIVDGNYNNGIMQMIGYLKSAGCLREDVLQWLVDQKFGTADKKYIQHRMRKWK